MKLQKKFCLKSETAQYLYKEYAENLPIFDYHCHLKPEKILQNRRFKNITEMWLAHDHYKWRLMRSNGISEYFITGDATDKDKFYRWVQTIEGSIGNPIYNWCYMELYTFFEINESICMDNAEYIWNKANQQIKNRNITPRYILEKMNVKVLGTTDNPLSDLMKHEQIKDTYKHTKVIPTMRIDVFLKIDSTLISSIEKDFNYKVTTVDEYIEFINSRINYFNRHECKSVDCGLGSINFRKIETCPDTTLKKILTKKNVNEEEMNDLSYTVLLRISKLIARKDWVLQLHIGALGSVNNIEKKRLGKSTGFDAIANQEKVSSSLIHFFNELYPDNQLPRTIIYDIDGNYNELIQSIIGCFQANEKGIKCKIQQGPAWWFQDTKSGIIKQLEVFSEQNTLINFVGMTTDSRSFLSYVRHDYFRRMLCNLIGTWIDENEIDVTDDFLKRFFTAVCYKNTKDYFRIDMKG